MSRIFNNLWIGGVDDVYDPTFIKRVMPTHIINCTVNERMYYGEFQCERLRIPLKDDETDDLNMILEGANKLNKFMETPDSNVIVHCAVGMSRSVTIVLTWMILYKKYKFIDAYNYVSEKRPIIRPNKFYMDFLKNLYFT
jgi:predicted protein tyrosine phosphatase